MRTIHASPALVALLLLLGCHGPGEPAATTPRADADTRPLTLADETDSDHDGVSDADEEAAGTDPFDSRSAPAWHPEWTERPRTIFGPDQAAEVLERLHRTDEPFATLAARIRSSCNASPAPYDDDDNLDQGAIYTNANIARNCAFLAYLENNATQAAKARDILLDLPRNLGKPTLELFDNTDIHVAEALSAAAQAYDFLAATNAVDSTSLDQIEDNILSLSASMYRLYVEVAPIWWQWCTNNHSLKSVSALGMVGMTLNDNPVAAKYVSLATTEADYIFDFQTTSDGGYAEGLGYLTYASDNFLPFIIMYHRFARGEAIPYRQICDIRRPGTGCTERPVVVPDFYEDTRVQNVYSWWVTLMMPDGLSPDFDDSNRRPTFNGLLAGITGQPYFRAAWERNTYYPYYSKDCEDLTVETLVFFPDTLPAQWPGFTNRFLDEAGTAVFRSGWEPDARYLLLLAEHGTVREGGHEHPDGTAVLIHAHGEYLVRDSGYGSWDQRQEVNQAENHSLVLIDGEGPHDTLRERGSGADTYLENCREFSDVVACDARTEFSEVEQVRTVFFVDNTFFVIRDRLSPVRGTTHNYSSIWHLNGGGDTDGDVIAGEDGAILERPGAGMVLGVASTVAPPVVKTYLASHSPMGYGQILQHEALSASVVADDLQLLGVVFPWPNGGTRASVSQVASSDGAAALLVTADDGAWAWLVAVTDPDTTTTLDLAPFGLPNVVTDAALAIVQFEHGEATSLRMEDGDILQIADPTVE